jgi:hypothetical protein
VHVVEENAEVLYAQRGQIFNTIDEGVGDVAVEIVEGFVRAEADANPNTNTLAESNKLRNLSSFLQGMGFYPLSPQKGIALRRIMEESIAIRGQSLDNGAAIIPSPGLAEIAFYYT